MLFDKSGIYKPLDGYKHMTGKILVDNKLMDLAIKGSGGDLYRATLCSEIRNEYIELYGKVLQ